MNMVLTAKAADICLAAVRAEKASERLELAYLGRMMADHRYINEAISGGLAWDSGIGTRALDDLRRECVDLISDHGDLVRCGLRQPDDDQICKLRAARTALGNLIDVADDLAERKF